MGSRRPTLHRILNRNPLSTVLLPAYSPRPLTQPGSRCCLETRTAPMVRLVVAYIRLHHPRYVCKQLKLSGRVGFGCVQAVVMHDPEVSHGHIISQDTL